MPPGPKNPNLQIMPTSSIIMPESLRPRLGLPETETIGGINTYIFPQGGPDYIIYPPGRNPIIRAPLSIASELARALNPAVAGIIQTGTVAADFARAVNQASATITLGSALEAAGGRANRSGPGDTDPAKQVEDALAAAYDHGAQSRLLLGIVNGWAKKLGIESWETEAFLQNLKVLNAPLIDLMVRRIGTIYPGGLFLVLNLNLLSQGVLKEAATHKESEYPPARDVTGEEKRLVEQAMAQIMSSFKTFYDEVHHREPPAERQGELKGQLMERNLPFLQAAQEVLIFEYIPFARMLGLAHPEEE